MPRRKPRPSHLRVSRLANLKKIVMGEDARELVATPPGKLYTELCLFSDKKNGPVIKQRDPKLYDNLLYLKGVFEQHGGFQKLGKGDPSIIGERPKHKYSRDGELVAARAILAARQVLRVAESVKPRFI